MLAPHLHPSHPRRQEPNALAQSRRVKESRSAGRSVAVLYVLTVRIRAVRPLTQNLPEQCEHEAHEALNRRSSVCQKPVESGMQAHQEADAH